MKEKSKRKIILKLIGKFAAIILALIGAFAGGSVFYSIHTNNKIISVIGDNNDVTINNVSDFIEEYQNLKKVNKVIRSQNDEYYEELEKLHNEAESSAGKYNEETDRLNSQIEQLNGVIEDLNKEINEFPDIQFKDLALSIDGDNIPLNTAQSSVVINNKTFYSYDFIENILDPDANVLVQDGVMYIGKIIADKASLLDQWIVDNRYVDINQNVVDSYGNTHIDSLCLTNYSSRIIYNLGEKYSMIRFNMAIQENAVMNINGILTIKADNEVVYTSPQLTKTTKPLEAVDIPINNCSLLTIEYNANYNNCILSDIIVYN